LHRQHSQCHLTGHFRRKFGPPVAGEQTMGEANQNAISQQPTNVGVGQPVIARVVVKSRG